MATTMDIKVPRNYLDVLQEQRGGFSFENCKRNQFLLSQTGIKPPTAMKSGTTICGVVIKDGVVVAADTRATMGPIVSDKNCEKLHRMADNMYCAGAGTAADLEHTTQLMEGQMELFRMSTGTTPRVCTVVKRLSTMLFKYQGYVGCALILGGYDPTGPHLYSIAPHGSTDKLPFATMGSGSLHAMSVLESGYKADMTKEEGVALVTNAIRAGILHDLGSGSNVDVCLITKDGADLRRNVDTSAPFMGMGGKDKLIKGQLKFSRSVLNELVLKETRKRLTKPADEDVEMEG